MRTGARETARRATRELESLGVPEPVASAEVLLSELLGIGRGEITLHDAPLTADQAERYEAWLVRRANREPVQRILGYAYFRNLVLRLNEWTLIPRPDTESVVDAALECLDIRDGIGVVLDVGTGSGAVATSIVQERPRAEVHATDVSEGALAMAERNARENGARVRFHHADLFAGLDALRGKVNLLVSNPPYVASSRIQNLPPEVALWDPGPSLDGGPDGMLFYGRIFAGAPPLLADGADVVLEVGDGQAEVVLGLGEDAGFTPIGSRNDLAGTPRAVLLRWEG